jgi:hypothetical protein
MIDQPKASDLEGNLHLGAMLGSLTDLPSFWLLGQ